jgi:hypothetical protein
MKIDDNWQLIKDQNDLILQKKKSIKAHRLTKPENVGKVKWVDKGYYVSIKAGLKAYMEEQLHDCEDIKNLRDKITEVENLIKNLY